MKNDRLKIIIINIKNIEKIPSYLKGFGMPSNLFFLPKEKLNDLKKTKIKFIILKS